MAGAGALLVLAGCSTYRAKPLDQAAVDQALEPKPLEAVVAAASQIRHPLVRPIEIDGRGGYTPDEIAVMVVIASPELRALRDQQGVADAQVIQAGLLPNPTFNYELDHPDAYPDPVGTQYSAGLTWNLTSILTHRSQVAAARAAAKSVNLSIAWQEWQYSEEARMRAFRILSLQRQLPLARAVENAEAESLAVTRKAVQIGVGTTVDLTTEAEAFTAAQNARFDIENQLANERAALVLSLGMPPGTLLRLKPASHFPEIAEGTSAAAELLGGLEDRRLDLVALRLGYQSQEEALRMAVWQQFPNIGIGFVRQRDTSVPPIYTNGPTVSVDLPIFDRGQGQVKIARATRRQLFDEYVARVAEARSDVTTILAELDIVRAQLAQARSSIPDLVKLVAAMRKANRSRNVDYQSYRDAESSLATRRIEESQLEQQEIELGVALEVATGRPLLDRQP